MSNTLTILSLHNISLSFGEDRGEVFIAREKTPIRSPKMTLKPLPGNAFIFQPNCRFPFTTIPLRHISLSFGEDRGEVFIAREKTPIRSPKMTLKPLPGNAFIFQPNCRFPFTTIPLRHISLPFGEGRGEVFIAREKTPIRSPKMTLKPLPGNTFIFQSSCRFPFITIPLRHISLSFGEGRGEVFIAREKTPIRSPKMTLKPLPGNAFIFQPNCRFPFTTIPLRHISLPFGEGRGEVFIAREKTPIRSPKMTLKPLPGNTFIF